MVSWLGRLFASSIGKKVAMALTGLLLVGFLVAHLAGNLLLFKDDGGAAFEAYAQKLHDLGPVLIVLELGLVALFAVHIGFAVRTILDNRRARGGSGSKYAVSASHGAKTLASATMPISGAIVLGFLIVHLVNFRFDEAFKERFTGDLHGEGSAAIVMDLLAEPLLALVYLVGVAALALHLTHGIKSAFQTLGANHPHLDAWLRPAAVALAVVLGLGFASLPILALLT